MMVEFTNNELTEVRLTRGFWRWKKVAIVRRDPLDRTWKYWPSCEMVEGYHVDAWHCKGLYWRIQCFWNDVMRERERAEALTRTRERMAAIESEHGPIWAPVARKTKIPNARVVVK